MRTLFLAILCLSACKSDGDEPAFYTYDDATDAPPLRGRGGPSVVFDEAELWTRCAQLDGGEEDLGFHNEMVWYRGHLIMPWAAEFGFGGLSLFNFDDPCAPEKVSDSFAQNMRETHAMGFVHVRDGPLIGDYGVANQMRGILFWDVSDPEAPVVASELELPDVFWPDAYARIAFSVFWQYPYVYVAAADNGLFVIDATNPYEPELLNQYVFEPGLRAGSVSVRGNTLFVVSAEQTEAAILDVSVPDQPQLFPGGRFTIRDADGTAREAYSGTMYGNWGTFAQKDAGAGVIIWDISDPTKPSFRSQYHIPEGNGGYVFWHEGVAFEGNSSAVHVIDFNDLDQPTLLGQAFLEGDQDTLTPIGNVAVLSVDDGAINKEASVVIPWKTEIDTRGPQVLAVDPADGSVGVPTSARIGVAFDEFVDSASVFGGSITVFGEDDRAVAGWGSAQETLANFSPKQPLKPNHTYTITVVSGGVVDLNGNAIDADYRWSFSTGSE